MCDRDHDQVSVYGKVLPARGGGGGEGVPLYQELHLISKM